MPISFNRAATSGYILPSTHNEGQCRTTGNWKFTEKAELLSKKCVPPVHHFVIRITK